MEIGEILNLYEKTINLELLRSYTSHGPKNIRIKGLSGSGDVFVCSSHTKSSGKLSLIILHDREEASYFLDDVKNISDSFTTLLFPTSYKTPYQFDEVENANILQRSQTLNTINQQSNKQSCMIITYPEALTEKVINKRSLVDNTFSAGVGEKVDIEFLAELMETYDFERAEFVYEPGQYSVRGGIIDVFSFSRDFPYRIELSGEEIESIREFNPESQLSIRNVDKLNIIPNIQTKLLKEERHSLLEYLPNDSIIWIKDHRETLDIIEKCFEKVTASFKELMEQSNYSQVSLSPDSLFENSSSFQLQLKKFSIIEFGKRFNLKSNEEIQFDFKPQPSFNKNFDLLNDNLIELLRLDYKVFIFSESRKQLNRLESIFDEIGTSITFEGINSALKEGFIDNQLKIAFYTDHQIFDRFHLFKAKEKFNSKKALTLKELKSLQTGDYVVHIDYGVGRFAGLDTVEVNDNLQEALRLIYRDNDLLYVSIHSLHKISKYSGKEGEPPQVNKLGSPEWDTKKKKVKSKVKDIAKDLIKLYAKRKAAPGYSFPPDNFLQTELESSFIYEDTPDQAIATSDVKNDMEQPHPMDRLVCGDVGFGKTEIAIRAAFKAVNHGKQVAILVPTTILAMQHYHTFVGRLKDFPVSIEYINRFKSAKEITGIKKGIKDGHIDILIGTQRIINKDIVFKDLGLIVIDEEQKFGVTIKERLKEMRINVDALTLTATPIPRTLHFSLMGARDLSIISTPPINRRPVTTEIHQFGEEIIRDAISHELRRNGQVFFVHNRISDIEKIANIIYKLVPEAKIGIAHGQMEGKQLEKIMLKFIQGDYDVLVSTNIIESGLDIPNANTIMINRAHMFGLSDLHQMRGRVGRSNTKAYCYLLTPPTSGLSSDARKRLITLEEFSDLGDGFNVAMKDLDIRGAGNLLGSEQSGFINDMGFDMYHKILDEAVHELKETEFKSLFENELVKSSENVKLVNECIIETDLELLIPYDYVSNTSERLQLYSSLDNIENRIDLETYVQRMKDRFGLFPQSVSDLIKSVELRWLGLKLGFNKITLKNNFLKCYMNEDKHDSYFQSDTFGQILNYVKINPAKCNMREFKGKLILTNKHVININIAIDILNQMTIKSEITQ